MFVFAIETCGKTVAYTHGSDRKKLDTTLKGGQFRDDIQFVTDRNGTL